MSDFILTVTPNPSIDKTAVVAEARLGAIHRPEQLIALPGGKGLNVARAVKCLGGEVQVGALLAGHGGRWVVDQLGREGISIRAAWANGETRTCLSIWDAHTKTNTEVYEAGPTIREEEWLRFESVVAEGLRGATLTTFSGSLPPGAPADGYARLARLAERESAPVLIDTHGEPLCAALTARPHLVKVNANEAGEWAGCAIESPAEAVVVAHRFREGGAASVVITLGAQGAVAVDAGGAWLAVPPSIEVVSAVGSGDALLGGLAFALQRRNQLVDALRLGVAAGAANALSLGAGALEVSTVWALAPRVVITALGGRSV